MAKNNNLTDFLTDVADAIRAKKGTTNKINPQDFASEIASIEGGGGIVQRVTYLRRVNSGYIDTGVNGANNNLKIVFSYAIRTFPTGYWRMISAYSSESTDTTRILLNKNTQILGNLNAVASGGSITATMTGYVGLINTVILEPASSSSFKLTTNGVTSTKTRVKGDALYENIIIFPKTSDNVDAELYECKIYDGNTLLRHFLPCVKEEEYGLWDAVTNQFFGNAGDGEFSGEAIDIEYK